MRSRLRAGPDRLFPGGARAAPRCDSSALAIPPSVLSTSLHDHAWASKAHISGGEGAGARVLGESMRPPPPALAVPLSRAARKDSTPHRASLIPSAQLSTHTSAPPGRAAPTGRRAAPEKQRGHQTRPHGGRRSKSGASPPAPAAGRGRGRPLCGCVSATVGQSYGRVRWLVWGFPWRRTRPQRKNEAWRKGATEHWPASLRFFVSRLTENAIPRARPLHPPPGRAHPGGAASPRPGARAGVQVRRKSARARNWRPNKTRPAHPVSLSPLPPSGSRSSSWTARSPCWTCPRARPFSR